MTASIHLAFLGFVLVTAVATAVLRDVLAAIIAFAAYSFGISLIWVFLKAPDVGLTEAAVGAGIMTIMFLVTITKTVRPPGEQAFESIHYPALLGTVLLIGVLFTTLPSLPVVGSPTAPVAVSEVTQYYLENSYTEIEVKNAVTAVLAAYRGFDTLGEALVVYAAGLGILVILNKEVFE